MKLENQVCSLELSKQLKKLGVKQDSIWYWKQHFEKGYKWILVKKRNTAGFKQLLLRKKGSENNDGFLFSAFTVAELGEMLPEKVCWRGYVNCNKKWSFQFEEFKAEDKTEANARAKMLIYLIENNLTKA